VVVHAAAAVRPIQKGVAITQSRFGILVDCNHDGLDVLIAVAFERTHAPHIGEPLIHGGFSAFASYQRINFLLRNTTNIGAHKNKSRTRLQGELFET
jgi:hypothetical protein